MPYTLLDLAKLNTSDVVRPLIELAALNVPEVGLFPAEQLGAGKLSYEALRRTGYPTTSFADVGQGYIPSKSTWDKDIFEVFKHGGAVKVPCDIADNNPRGGAAGLQSMEAQGVMKVALFNIARQIYYGRVADGKGFPGLKNFAAYGTTFTDPISGRVFNLTIDAGGTSANAASSVYFVKFSTDPQSMPDGIQLELGKGSPFVLPDFIKAPFDMGGGATLLHYYSELEGFVGLQIAHPHCVRRICNLTAQAGHTLTDALLAQAMAEFPAGMKPDAILMPVPIRRQLQTSRTVTLFGEGETRPNQPTLAPLPTEYDGVPIIPSDAIGITDAIEVAQLADE